MKSRADSAGPVGCSRASTSISTPTCCASRRRWAADWRRLARSSPPRRSRRRWRRTAGRFIRLRLAPASVVAAIGYSPALQR
jgi:hypothetical protein